MKLTHYISYTILRILAYFARTLDDQEAYDFGAGLGRFVMRVLKSRRGIALENLANALPELSESEREGIADRVFENVGRTIVELARFPLYTPELVDKMVQVPGTEVIEEMSVRRKGCLFVASHFGNWELIGAWPPAHGYTTSFLAGRQSNLYIDRLLNELRRTVGVNIFHTGSSARKVIAALRRGEFIGVVPDQHSAIGHVVVTFFGRKIAAHKGPALFAYRTGASLLPVFLVRVGPAQHEGWLEEPIYADKNQTEEHEIQRITQLYFNLLEKAIRKHPDMWMWTHRRWKPVPGLSSSKS